DARPRGRAQRPARGFPGGHPAGPGHRPLPAARRPGRLLVPGQERRQALGRGLQRAPRRARRSLPRDPAADQGRQGRRHRAGLPPGVTTHTAIIAPTESHADIVLQAATDAPGFAGQLKLTATAALDGKSVSRPVRGAEVLYAVADMQKDPFVTRVTDGIALAV